MDLFLCHMFREKKRLVDNKHLNVEKKMAMFLMTISHNLQNRLIKNRFQHSSQTIHKYFHEALVAMVNFSKEMITPPSFNDSSNGISNRSENRAKTAPPNRHIASPLAMKERKTKQT